MTGPRALYWVKNQRSQHEREKQQEFSLDGLLPQWAKSRGVCWEWGVPGWGGLWEAAVGSQGRSGRGSYTGHSGSWVFSSSTPAAGRLTVSAGERRGETWHAHWVRKQVIPERWWTGRTEKSDNAMKAMRTFQRKERAKTERQTVNLWSGRSLFKILKAE